MSHSTPPPPNETKRNETKQNEIEKKHWFINKANSKQIFEINVESIWKKQLEKIKPSYTIFGDFSTQPSIN